MLLVAVPSVSAETLVQALASAYSYNPSLNAARAGQRATDESVPLAKSAYFPTFTGSGGLATSHTFNPVATTTHTGSLSLSVTQTIFNGFRRRNALRQSEISVLAGREALRNTVQNVLFDAAQAYMDVLRDIAILDIRQRNVIFLDEQVRAANERFNVGENTRTDVAQARARVAAARSAVSLAEANLSTSRATYRRVIGHDPDNLVAGFPFTRLIPKGIQEAIAIGQDGHPTILQAIDSADSAGLAVKQAEGALLPTLSVSGSLSHSEDLDNPVDPNSASISGSLTIPLLPASAGPAIRQAKEQYGQAKIGIDIARDQVRAAVVTAWAQEKASVGAISAAEEGVSAANIALSGVQEEQRVGQRTTLDVLDAQQELLSANETIIVARHDRAVAYFSVLSAVGRLTAEALSLPAPGYDPTEHYRAVKNKIYGSRTPDGR